jgi:hypothetical protein
VVWPLGGIPDIGHAKTSSRRTDVTSFRPVKDTSVLSSGDGFERVQRRVWDTGQRVRERPKTCELFRLSGIPPHPDAHSTGTPSRFKTPKTLGWDERATQHGQFVANAPKSRVQSLTRSQGVDALRRKQVLLISGTKGLSKKKDSTFRFKDLRPPRSVQPPTPTPQG